MLFWDRGAAALFVVAVALARRTGYAFKIVTLEGDVINPSGSITGGSKKNDIANIFSHERELKELDEIVAKLSGELETLNKRKDKCAEELEQVQNDIKDIQQEIHLTDVDIAAKSETRNKLRTDVDDEEREFAELSADLDRDKTRVEEISADIDSVSELEALITSKKQSVTEDDETVRHAYDELKAEYEADETLGEGAAAGEEAKWREMYLDMMFPSAKTLDRCGTMRDFGKRDGDISVKWANVRN